MHVFLYDCIIYMIPVYGISFSVLASFHILVEPQKYKMNSVYIFLIGYFSRLYLYWNLLFQVTECIS